LTKTKNFRQRDIELALGKKSWREYKLEVEEMEQEIIEYRKNSCAEQKETDADKSI
jgi:hypothetical protein